ncbi:hypothetical protein [Kitasatospora sp. NPDC057015]|uniref:hypothetical protein n=1 Tax=Kitasatospora sp. NPDC057015 TaxID=3346001 RepID=UPI0036440E92
MTRPEPPALNQRQASYLMVLFTLDQEAEHEQQRRWQRRRARTPAHAWRWIPYTVRGVDNAQTQAQQRLDAEGLRDTGSGSTLAALVRRGLLELRRVMVDTAAGRAQRVDVRVTAAGRAACRAALAPGAQPCAPVADWMLAVLRRVEGAGADGLARYEVGRSAARALGGKGMGYIEDAHPWSYRLTKLGAEVLSTASRTLPVHPDTAPRPSGRHRRNPARH